MALLGPSSPDPVKPKSHPWENRIKDIFSHRYKHAHNSINNPIYPRKKVPPSKAQIKFTVIGDRITKEFLYCTRLVRGLHKYRRNTFEAPEIRGVNTVEWPAVWNDLKIKYRGIAFCLPSSVAVIINDTFLGGEAELRKLVDTKYDYHVRLNYYNESVAEFAKYIQSSGRPCAYMHISIAGQHVVGSLIFMLYADIVPKTCDNFLRLCKEKRGGYSGTPIHRIVKDGWIQGGGFGLKKTELDCENFMIPHDRRGVLGMANAGRHIDCSTQFYVLLQPAPWMTHKVVAFGQLIEGIRTLEKIEEVSTWYESPNSEIRIYEAGIFNMDCHDLPSVKGVNAYVDGHIEDLNDLKELLYELLLERVFLTAQLREIDRLNEQLGEGENDTEVGNIRATKRFIRNKEDIEKQLQTSRLDSARPPSTSRPATADSQPSTSTARRPKTPKSQENKDFDVETYDLECEYEGTEYKHQSISGTASTKVKLKMPYYIAPTDVKYPGEIDSNFDLKRFLQGDYCLESDLQEPNENLLKYPSNLSFELEETVAESDELDSDEEIELKKFLENKVDHVSFIGKAVKNISKSAYLQHIFWNTKKIELLTDEELRRLRLASIEYAASEHREKKVSISMPTAMEHHSKIKRRQTGFVHPEDLQKLEMIRLLSIRAKREVGEDEENEEEEVPKDKIFTEVDDGYGIDDGDDGDDGDDADDDDDEFDDSKRQVLIAEPDEPKQEKKMNRRQTGYVRKEDLKKIKISLYDDDADDEDDNMQKKGDATIKRRQVAIGLDDDDGDMKSAKKSALHRLFEEVATVDVEQPTLKYYKPVSDYAQRNMYLKYSPNLCTDDETNRERARNSLIVDNSSMEQLLNLQHGKKARKISSDYVKTIDQIEHDVKNSIRSVEFAKTRPAMTVADYQMKNKSYQKLLATTSITTILDPAKNFDNQRKRTGIRLPGDSPIYSMIEIPDLFHR